MGVVEQAPDVNEPPIQTTSSASMWGDVSAMGLNICASVVIIFVNKHLMTGSNHHVGFSFGMGLHACAPGSSPTQRRRCVPCIS